MRINNINKKNDLSKQDLNMLHNLKQIYFEVMSKLNTITIKNNYCHIYCHID